MFEVLQGKVLVYGIYVNPSNSFPSISFVEFQFASCKINHGCVFYNVFGKFSMHSIIGFYINKVHACNIK